MPPPIFVFFFLPVGFFVLLLLVFLVHHRLFPRKRLPPGSMGWPYIGETLQLYSQNPNVFFASKQRRYGEVFKTRILGCKCVMVASPEAAKFVLVTEARRFAPSFPASKQAIIGPNALFFHDGPYHAALRRLLLSSFISPASLRRLLPSIERLALSTLHSWHLSHPSFVPTFSHLKHFSFRVGLLKIFGNEECVNVEELSKAYGAMEQGYNCMAINIPGTKFWRACKARRKVRAMVEEVIRGKRREEEEGITMGKEELEVEDLLGKMARYKGEDKEDDLGKLSVDQMVDNVIGVIFASRDTTASVLTWLIKFLTSSPALLDSVTAEHEGIRRRKAHDQEHLTWEDTRNMPLTTRVIQETLRVATVLSFTFREATEDVVYKDYIIPKGWKVMPLFRNIHHSPVFFPEPHKFDPSRFEVPLKPNTFLPFGNGVHSCPGSELAKLEMLVFIHHLTTKFRWELDETKNGVQYSPFLVPQDGLPIRVEKI